MSRAASAGRVLFEFSRPNRKWWWLAIANMASVITTFLYGGETSRSLAALFLAQAIVFRIQATWGVQARERGLLMPLEIVPWKRVNIGWTEPNHVSVTVRRSLNWNTTYTFPVTPEKKVGITNFLQQLRQPALVTVLSRQLTPFPDSRLDLTG